jgi:hypothetical protein
MYSVTQRAAGFFQTEGTVTLGPVARDGRPNTVGSQAIAPSSARPAHTPSAGRHPPPSAVLSGILSPEARAAPPTTERV